MVINVFGIWLMAMNISYLVPDRGNCFINFTMGGPVRADISVRVNDKSCDEVAKEINKKNAVALER